MSIPIRTELTVLSGDVFCKKCHMRLHPGQEHTEEICIVAQVMEYEEVLGWSMTEYVGIGAFNPRAITKIKK
jgi:hypothetical protein